MPESLREGKKAGRLKRKRSFWMFRIHKTSVLFRLGGREREREREREGERERETTKIFLYKMLLNYTHNYI